MTLSTVERAVKVLQHVVFGERVIGTSETAKLLDTSRSSAHRLLKTLGTLGLLKKDEATSKFGAGPELYRLAAALFASNDLLQAARPLMNELAGETGEAVFLCLRSGDYVIFVDRVSSRHELQYVVPLGETVHIHAGASGQSILAWLPHNEIERIIGNDLACYTARTITDPTTLRENLQSVRTQGYAVTYGQRVEGGVGFGAPIFDSRKRVIGSLLLSIPESRLNNHGPIPEIGKHVREVADRISLRLGGAQPSKGLGSETPG
jgi:IclR family acetate operon transcriptional repressor